MNLGDRRAINPAILSGVAGFGLGASVVAIFAIRRMQRNVEWMKGLIDTLTVETQNLEARRKEWEGGNNGEAG